jgi:hypothetical protein
MVVLECDWAWLKRYLSLIQWFSGFRLILNEQSALSIDHNIEIRLHAQCLCVEDLELSSDQFLKWYSWSRIGLIAEVCLSDSVEFHYSHCRNAQLLFGVDHRIEIRLLWEIGGIWLKWCRERIELVRASMIFPLMIPFRRNSENSFRILTFPSICATICQSNSMRRLYFWQIWSYSMLNWQNGDLGVTQNGNRERN